MAIERALTEDPVPVEEGVEEEFEIEIIEPEAVSIETEDGGMLIDFRSEGEMQEDSDFNANLAELMEDTDLGSLASELTGAYSLRGTSTCRLNRTGFAGSSSSSLTSSVMSWSRMGTSPS